VVFEACARGSPPADAPETLFQTAFQTAPQPQNQLRLV
jgi:hypothetical protein